MQLSWIGMMGAAVIAAPAIAAPNPSGALAPPDTRASMTASQASGAARSAAASPPQRAAVQTYVDLNRASRKELMTLPGIGAPEASRIIANRPYLTKTDLVTKNVMPVGPFLSIKNLVVAMPTTVSSKGRH